MKEPNLIVIIANAHHGMKPDPVNGIFLIDRRTPVGNPFVLYDEAQRDEVCKKYDVWFYEVGLRDPKVLDYLKQIKSHLDRYDKVTLLCWCIPKRCHGFTIKKWLEKPI